MPQDVFYKEDIEQTKIHNKRKTETPNCVAFCLVCKKFFVNQWNLQRHQKKEHGVTENDNDAQNRTGIGRNKTETHAEETMAKMLSEVTPPISGSYLRRDVLDGIYKSQTAPSPREKRQEYLCHQCEYSSRRKTNLERHMKNSHNGIRGPETRGRKRKIGPISKRTKYRRRAEGRSGLIFSDVIGMDF